MIPIGRTRSEFYRLTVGTSGATPIDLAGARQVLIQCHSNAIWISNQQDFGNYFLLLNGDPTTFGSGRISVTSGDDRLFVRAVGGDSVVEVWVMK